MDQYILLTFFIGCLLISILCGLRTLFVYGRKDERTGFVNLLIIFFILIGYMLCWGIVLLQPVDVYFNLSIDLKQYLNMFTFYRSFYWICLFYIFFLTPLLCFIYLNKDNNNFLIDSGYRNKNVHRIKNVNMDKNNINNSSDNRDQISSYNKNTRKELKQNKNICLFVNKQQCENFFSRFIPCSIILFFFIFCIFFFTYKIFGKFDIHLNSEECKLWFPYTYKTNKEEWQLYDVNSIEHCDRIIKRILAFKIELKFNDYIIICVSFIGYFLFTFYCGIGLVSFPLDLIKVFINRRKKIKEQEFRHKLAIINKQAKKLIEFTNNLESKNEKMIKMNYFKYVFAKISYKNKKKTLKYLVYNLEKEYTDLMNSYNKPTNVLYAYTSLVCSLIFILLSIVVFMHLVFYILLKYKIGTAYSRYFMFLDTIL
ncbi:conserved membrane protein, unknown function, partial [Hepatocystis sp. ex Piliocolobus tephrosceles]